MTWSRAELLAAVLSRQVAGAHHLLVGAASPIPAAAGLLARETARTPMAVTILGSSRHFPFTDGGREVFDFAGRGRIDAFFLGGGQIDGAGNVNLVGAGDYPRSATRFPGSFGAAYLYFLVPRVVLFREEHSRRVLVPKVDFVSAPGVSPEGVHRPGGPVALVTGKACFAFDRTRGRFRLVSVHPGHSLDEILDETGFDCDHAESVPQTAPPTADECAILRGSVRDELAAAYPEFVASRLNHAHAAP